MKQTSGWSRSNGTPHDEPNIEDILASGIVLLPRTRTVSLLELRTVARHFWKASDMIKANPRLIRRVYEVLDDNGKIKFLAQLQSLFTSLGKLATFSAPRICWEGAPCLTDNLRRHSIALSIETVWESGWENIGITGSQELRADARKSLRFPVVRIFERRLQVRRHPGRCFGSLRTPICPDFGGCGIHLPHVHQIRLQSPVIAIGVTLFHMRNGSFTSYRMGNVKE
jgi:hypothetical protein